ncbi:hypothetical protein [Bradyrhizobium sp.]|uniref:hypothetical protein n=1 Tax=Bradyrhizobium sp. TaxID=376 RepID=UPI0039E2B8BB
MLVLGGLAITGSLLYVIGPESAPPSPAVRHALLTTLPELIQPEPREAFVYFGMLLASPLIVYGACRLARRWKLPSAPRYGDRCALLAFVAGAAAVRPWNVPFLSELPRHALESGLPWKPLVIAAAAAALLFHARAGTGKLARYLVAGAICILATLLIFSWLVFGAAAVEGADATFVSHWDATLYSITQIAHGSVCLYDIVPQYGCYGEFLRPVFAIIGLSVTSATLVLATLQSLSSIAIIGFSFVIFRSTLLAAAASLCFLLFSNTVFYVSAGQYFQYMPIRLLFPAFSLWCFFFWSRRSSFARAALIGIFGGLALFWNLDSGAVVATALGLLILFVDAGAGEAPLPVRLRRVAVYCCALAATILVALLYLCLRAGALVDPAGLTYYQSIFFGLGFLMLPMSPAPDYWTIGVAILAIVLSFYAAAAAGPRSTSLEGAAYLAVLGAGLLSYFIGRSHVVLFMLAAWPIVILTFYVLDHYQARFAAVGQHTVAALLRSVGAVASVLALAAIAGRLPHIEGMTTRQWAAAIQGDPASPVVQDADFISQTTALGDRIALFAENQASLLAESNRRSFINPGFVETLLRTDVDKTVSAVEQDGPKHLFISRDLLGHDHQLFVFEPWVRDNYERLTLRYRLSESGPGDRLLHFVRIP